MHFTKVKDLLDRTTTISNTYFVSITLPQVPSLRARIEYIHKLMIKKKIFPKEKYRQVH